MKWYNACAAENKFQVGMNMLAKNHEEAFKKFAAKYANYLQMIDFEGEAEVVVRGFDSKKELNEYLKKDYISKKKQGYMVVTFDVKREEAGVGVEWFSPHETKNSKRKIK